MKIFLLSFLLFLVACSNEQPVRHVVDTVDVNIPILERAAAPKELFRTKIPDDSIPRWVAPSDPAATACVTKSGEPMLKIIMLNRESLLDGWESYAPPIP